LPPEPARLRRSVAVTTAVITAVFGALAILFGAVLEPGEDRDSCTTGLYPGTYADAIVPAHLLAYAILALLAAWISAQLRASRRPGRITLAALAAVTGFALAAAIHHPLMDWPALIALIVALPIGGVVALVGLTNTVLTLSSKQPPRLGWAWHARLAQATAWVAIVLGLPAAVAAAWTNGAGLFCF
jgi:hypothetical protein